MGCIAAWWISQIPRLLSLESSFRFERRFLEMNHNCGCLGRWINTGWGIHEICCHLLCTRIGFSMTNCCHNVSAFVLLSTLLTEAMILSCARTTWIERFWRHTITSSNSHQDVKYVVQDAFDIEAMPTPSTSASVGMEVKAHPLRKLKMKFTHVDSPSCSDCGREA